MLLHIRLRRMMVRVHALAWRAQAGTLTPRPPGKHTATPKPRTKDRLPRGVGWLIPLVPWEAAGRGGQLQHLLSQPDMKDFLAAAPQLRRLLHPLCRALGIADPDDIPARPPAAAPAVATRSPATEAPGSDWACVLGIWRPSAKIEA